MDDDKVVAALEDIKDELHKAINRYLFFWGGVMALFAIVDVGFLLHIF